MTVLVTGGAGLVGMAVRRTLARHGRDVVAVDRTDFGRGDPGLHIAALDDIDGLRTLASARPIDAIVHCGAISGPMMAKGDPRAIVETNIVGTATMLDLARDIVRDRGGCRYVFCSSISVYGSVGGAVITEDTPLHPSSVYGASKVAGEQLVEGYAAEYGVSGVSLRISRVYGPHRRGDCLIRKMVEEADAAREAVIPCEDGFLYHYIHVDDVASAILSALVADRIGHHVYNVASNIPATMGEVVAAAQAVLPGLRVRLVPGRDDVPDIQAGFDTMRIAADLGWQARLDLERGIAAYAAALHAA